MLGKVSLVVLGLIAIVMIACVVASPQNASAQATNDQGYTQQDGRTMDQGTTDFENAASKVGTEFTKEQQQETDNAVDTALGKTPKNSIDTIRSQFLGSVQKLLGTVCPSCKFSTTVPGLTGSNTATNSSLADAQKQADQAQKDYDASFAPFKPIIPRVFKETYEKAPKDSSGYARTSADENSEIAYYKYNEQTKSLDFYNKDKVFTTYTTSTPVGFGENTIDNMQVATYLCQGNTSSACSEFNDKLKTSDYPQKAIALTKAQENLANAKKASGTIPLTSPTNPAVLSIEAQTTILGRGYTQVAGTPAFQAQTPAGAANPGCAGQSGQTQADCEAAQARLNQLTPAQATEFTSSTTVVVPTTAAYGGGK